MAVWGLGFFEAPSSRTNTFSAATGCAAVMGRSVGNVPAALTFLPSSVYWIPSQGKGPRNWVPETRASFRKHDRQAGGVGAEDKGNRLRATQGFTSRSSIFLGRIDPRV